MIKHTITQNTDGINLTAKNDDKTVSISCNSTQENIDLLTKNVSIKLDSNQNISIKTQTLEIKLDEPAKKLSITNADSKVLLDGPNIDIQGKSKVIFSGGSSKIVLSDSGIDIQGQKINIKGTKIDIG